MICFWRIGIPQSEVLIVNTQKWLFLIDRSVFLAVSAGQVFGGLGFAVVKRNIFDMGDGFVATRGVFLVF